MRTKPAPVRSAAAFVAAVAVAACWAQPASATFAGNNGRIVFMGGLGLATMDLDGTGRVNLGESGSSPAWSPDGGRIAYENGGSLYLVNADGTSKRPLGVSGGGPAWSPDGTKIAFATGTGISVINADGTGLVDLTDTPDGGPSWSPDGSKIAFQRFDLVTGQTGVWVMDADGSNPHELFDNDALNAAIDWSPDGSTLIFQSSTGDGTRIYTMDSDGSNPPVQRGLTGDNNPVFSPDGALIAFRRIGYDGLWTMNVDGTNQVRRTLTDAFGADWQPLHLTLGVSKRKVQYNGTVTLTVHLLHADSTNKDVSVYATAYGGSEQLITSEAVDAAGNLSITVNVPTRTDFRATWSGDTEHPAGGTSDRKRVLVYVALNGRLTRYDASAGGYRLYDYTSACPNRQRGCPTYVVSIAPDHSGMRLFFTLQLRINGRWRTVLDFAERIPDTNKIVEKFIYGNRSVIGLPTRVRAKFKGDADHLAARTAWSYFKVTA
jgi:dipeptidyl aminopeptidase/acylaminoacyl peptidase